MTPLSSLLSLCLRISLPSPLSRASDASEALGSVEQAHDGLQGIAAITPVPAASSTTTDGTTGADSTTTNTTTTDSTATDRANTTDAAAAVLEASLEAFRSVQGMGPAIITSLLNFARAESGNREVVEALASEVRFAAVPPGRRRRQRRLQPATGGGVGVGDGDGEVETEISPGEGGGSPSWVEGKTVVFTGSLTRYDAYG